MPSHPGPTAGSAAAEGSAPQPSQGRARRARAPGIGARVRGLQAVFITLVVMVGLTAALVLEDMPPLLPTDPPREIPTGPEPGETCDWRAVAALRSWRNDPDPAWWDFAPDIRARTLVVGGAQSYMPQDRLAELARLIPRGRFVSLDTTHTVHGDRPGEFLALVEPFLDDAIR